MFFVSNRMAREWKAYIKEAKSYLNKKSEIQAQKSIERGLKLMPNQLNLLIAASNLYRETGHRDKSLEYSQRLISCYPNNIVGYRGAVSDLQILERLENAKILIESALKKFPNHPEIVAIASNFYRRCGNIQKSIQLGLSIIAHYPRQRSGYECIAKALSEANKTIEVRSILEEGLSLDPKSVFLSRVELDILLLAREYSRYRMSLYSAVREHPSHAERFLNALLTSELTHDIPASSSGCYEGCDVICIASNEAPYISEFIHHYLYLGFRNIYVGINSCSDATELILSKVSAVHSNVIVIDVNRLIKHYGQRGCYTYLFDHARKGSSSSYCLFVDVDEYWAADPFSIGIDEFLLARHPFDTFSFQWMNTIETVPFAPPLSHPRHQWNHHVKSILCYTSEYLAIRLHAPILANIPKPCARLGNSVNRNLTKTLCGYNVHEKSIDPTISRPEIAGQAWIYHRALRSELEYAFRLFRRRPSDNEGIPFKSNRRGYTAPDSKLPNVYSNVLSKCELDQYHSSLADFVGRCDLHAEIANARSCVSEVRVWDTLKSLPENVLRNNSDLAMRCFKGTRFLEWIALRT